MKPLDARIRVSVVVVSTGFSRSLRDCLARLRPQVETEYAELIVVINAAEETLDEAQRSILVESCDELVFEPRAGKSCALNLGVAMSRGEVVAFTDDDTLPEPGWLNAICEPLLFATDERLAGCGGRVIPIFPQEPAVSWFEALVLRKETSFLGPRHDLGDRDRNYVYEPSRRTLPIGANCAFRREILEHYPYNARLGPNRATGGRGGEDSELGLRILRDGLSLRYCAKAMVLHPVSPDRMTREYVEEGYRVSGVERMRVSRALGLPLPTRLSVRINIVAGELKRLIARLRAESGGDGPTHLDLKQAYRRGVLTELSRRKP